MTAHLYRNRLSRGGLLLSDPALVGAWKASTYSGSGDLLDQSTKGHHMQLGSTPGADVNDPLFLPSESGRYVYHPGGASNFISTPDDASLDIAGDIDLRAQLALESWTPAALQMFMAKHQATGQLSFHFYVQSAGTLVFSLSADGTAVGAATSSVSTGLAEGAKKWVRATWRQSDGRVQFFLSDDGTAWTQLGTDRTIAIASIFNSTSPVELGSNLNGANNRLIGKLYRAQIRNGIDGTLVAAFDSSLCVEPYATVTDSVGKVWTLNRSTGVGRKLAVVDRPLFMFNTDDYMETPDHADFNIGIFDSFTVVALLRQYPTPAASHVVTKRNSVAGTAGNVGWCLRCESTIAHRIQIDDGVVAAQTGSSAVVGAGVTHTAVGIRDVALDQLRTTTSSSADTTALTMANTLPVRIGRAAGTSTVYTEMEFFGAAFFRRVLTPAEYTTVAAELLA